MEEKTQKNNSRLLPELIFRKVGVANGPSKTLGQTKLHSTQSITVINYYRYTIVRKRKTWKKKRKKLTLGCCPELIFRKVGVVNGPSKTLGLAKFSSNFTGLTVSFLKRFCASRSLVFYTKVSRSLDFLQGL